MMMAWVMFGCFVFLAVASFHGSIYKLVKKQYKNQKEKFDFVFSALVSVLILVWGMAIIFNLANLRGQLANAGWGLAICLVLTYQGLPIELPEEPKN